MATLSQPAYLWRTISIGDTFKPSVGFPFYDIFEAGENGFTNIEFAVAGYSKHELEVETIDGVLHVRGKPEDDTRKKIFNGISRKSFDRAFKLTDHTTVYGVELNNGILRITLKTDIPEEQKPKKYKIG